MRKKRKLEDSEDPSARVSDASCGDVRDLDACEVHVVTFSTPEFFLDAAEAAMLLKSALAPTHSKSAFSVAATATEGAPPRTVPLPPPARASRERPLLS